ncbi:MAG TPA: MurR/RpiR family transcriptional regulator, partial [bacterium]
MKAPKSYEDLRQAIVAGYPAMSRQLQHIGRHAIDHPQEVAMGTVAVLAKRVGVQPSSLVRFAQALGYPGFSDMQQVFRSQLMRQFTSIQERVRTLGRAEAQEAPDARALLRSYVREGVDALERLPASVEAAALEEAVRVLAQAGQVYVLAQGRAFPVAYYLAFALARLERRALLLSGVGGMQLQRQQAELATPRDALLAVSFRPYTELVIDIAGELKARGVPVIAMTDSRVSPLAQQATVLLQVREEGQPMFLSLVAPVCLSQALVVALGQRLAEGENAGRATASRVARARGASRRTRAAAKSGQPGGR